MIENAPLQSIRTPFSKLTITPHTDFMNVLKARIAEAIPVSVQKANAPTYIKTAVILSWFSLSYFSLFYFHHPVALIAACVSLGFANAGVGFNIFHDSIHGALSCNRSVNRFWAWLSCSLLGPSHFIWRHKHNYLHHQFPNVEGWDDDLETRGALRLSPHQPWTPKHRYQHYYAPLAYALTTFEWLFIRDYARYFSKQMNDDQRLPKMKPLDHVEFWTSKLIHFALTVVAPLCFFSPLQFLIGFVIVHAITSVTLAIIFQLAHVMPKCSFPIPKLDSGKIDLNWVHLQLATTTNFAPKNFILNWYAGGLNYQVEHHMLPNICHEHYSTIAPILEKTAKEFGYPYHVLSDHWQAISGHFSMLKEFSKQPISTSSI